MTDDELKAELRRRHLGGSDEDVKKMREIDGMKPKEMARMILACLEKCIPIAESFMSACHETNMPEHAAMVASMITIAKLSKIHDFDKDVIMNIAGMVFDVVSVQQVQKEGMAQA